MNRKLTGLLAGFALLALASSLTGCVGINIVDERLNNNRMTAEGSLVAQEYPGGEYTRAELSANLRVIYESTPSDTVRVELQENLLPYLEVSVENGKLFVNSTTRFLFPAGVEMGRVYLSTPELEELVVAGSIQMGESDPVVGPRFALDVTGACDVKLEVQVEELDIQVAGAGDLTLEGTATHFNLEMFGAGRFDGQDLQTKVASVDMSGAGAVEIACSDQLDAAISGSGSLNYYGDPQLNTDISGAASVRKREH